MSLNQKMSEKEAMALAIRLAEKAQGFVLPNPPVGCVFLDRSQRLLSQGFYSHYGAIHAEISALNKIKNKNLLKGAHLFVTLEPCFHFGQNPPCLNSLLKLPLASITYGREDPNPKTKGKSLKKLRQKGFLVKKSPYFRKTIERLYEAFTFNMEQKKTFFALKLASSLDGMSSLSSGESQWITEKSSKEFVFYLRSVFDAVLIGPGTFLEDKPRLNIRKKGFEKYSNKVCILDPKAQVLNLIQKSPLAKVRSMDKIFLITGKKISKKWPFPILQSQLLPDKMHFDLKSLSRKLYTEAHISSVLVEGGIKIFSSFLQQNQAQRLYQFINPSLIGGVCGRSWTESLSIASLKERKKLKSVEILPCGKDFLLTGILSV